MNSIEVISKKKRKPIQYEINKNGCWNCTSHCKNKDGYPTININGKKVFISRYIYETYYNLIPSKLVIRHKCDNPSCINPQHLEIGTQQDNMNDKVKRGRQSRVSFKGENNPRAKLTQLQVDSIRKDNKSDRLTAIEYDVSIMQVYRIRNNASWKQ